MNALDNVLNMIGWLSGTVIPQVAIAGGDTISLEIELKELEDEEYGIRCALGSLGVQEFPVCPCGKDMEYNVQLAEDYTGWQCPTCETLLDDIEAEDFGVDDCPF